MTEGVGGVDLLGVGLLDMDVQPRGDITHDALVHEDLLDRCGNERALLSRHVLGLRRAAHCLGGPLVDASFGDGEPLGNPRHLVFARPHDRAAACELYVVEFDGVHGAEVGLSERTRDELLQGLDGERTTN